MADLVERHGLEEAERIARHDLARLNYPPANWVPEHIGPDGQRVLDVLVVGAGMCGQTAGWNLIREGIRNIRVIDRNPHGREGPWNTTARMPILRSPKHLTGPDLGVPSLTFRAWYEAQHGAEGWETLYKVLRLDWMDYLVGKSLIKPDTRSNLLGNRIVLIAPKDTAQSVDIKPSFDLAKILGDGRLSMANIRITSSWKSPHVMNSR